MLAHAKGDMGVIIAVNQTSGARPHELIKAHVGVYQPNARTLVLGRDNSSRTVITPVSRTITLNADAHAILARRCDGHRFDRTSNSIILLTLVKIRDSDGIGSMGKRREGYSIVFRFSYRRA